MMFFDTLKFTQNLQALNDWILEIFLFTLCTIGFFVTEYWIFLEIVS